MGKKRIIHKIMKISIKKTPTQTKVISFQNLKVCFWVTSADIFVSQSANSIITTNQMCATLTKTQQDNHTESRNLCIVNYVRGFP